jgi:hypothetical protein
MRGSRRRLSALEHLGRLERAAQPGASPASPGPCRPQRVVALGRRHLGKLCCQPVVGRCVVDVEAPEPREVVAQRRLRQPRCPLVVCEGRQLLLVRHVRVPVVRVRCVLSRPTRCGRRSSPNGIRTRAATLRGWCPRPLDDGASSGGSIYQWVRRRPTGALRPASALLRAAGRGSSGERTRTPKSRTRTCCVANYTTPERAAAW